jgi:hypothetical protein
MRFNCCALLSLSIRAESWRGLLSWRKITTDETMLQLWISLMLKATVVSMAPNSIILILCAFILWIKIILLFLINF